MIGEFLGIRTINEMTIVGMSKLITLVLDEVKAWF